MKKRTIVLILMLCGMQVFPDTAGKAIPPYVINSVDTDSTLSEKEAVVVFVCREMYGTYLMKNKDIIYAYSGKNLNTKTNEAGTFTVMLKPGTYTFAIAADLLHKEIRVPDLEVKRKTRTTITLNFENEGSMQPMKKPVIYLYPPTSMQVNVKLNVTGGLDFSYPAYDKGWTFTADPNGDLHFGEKTYSYLFWEGNAKMEDADLNSSEGFVVNGNELIGFFEEKLSAMGLTSRERADFITYWCPLMNKHKKCFVHFLFREELEKYALLSIEPAPAEIFRVFMLWRPLENEKEMEKISGQRLPMANRKDFTAIEWGGTEIVPVKP